MASGLTTSVSRRADLRRPPEEIGCARDALLRPGRDVKLINVSSGGALLESEGRMNPGVRAELQIVAGSRRYVRGRISRSRISRLAPLCYEAAIVFDEPFDVALNGNRRT